jgi:hypothetical protein
MALFSRAQRSASYERKTSTAAPSGWYESSFELMHGLELIEDVSFEEYERLCALNVSPQASATRPQDRSHRPR